MELAKQMFGKQIFVGPCSNDGGQRGILGAFARFPTIYIPSFPLSTYLVIFDGNSLLETSHLSTFFRQLLGSSKFLPESFGSWLFSAWNNLHTKETFWGGRFCSPPFLSHLHFHDKIIWNTSKLCRLLFANQIVMLIVNASISLLIICYVASLVLDICFPCFISNVWNSTGSMLWHSFYKWEYLNPW